MPLKHLHVCKRITVLASSSSLGQSATRWSAKTELKSLPACSRPCTSCQASDCRPPPCCTAHQQPTVLDDDDGGSKQLLRFAMTMSLDSSALHIPSTRCSKSGTLFGAGVCVYVIGVHVRRDVTGYRALVVLAQRACTVRAAKRAAVGLLPRHSGKITCDGDFTTQKLYTLCYENAHLRCCSHVSQTPASMPVAMRGIHSQTPQPQHDIGRRTLRRHR
jgi:hypothetical protein